MALLNPGGAIAQFQRNDRSIPPVEVISRSGVRIFDKYLIQVKLFVNVGTWCYVSLAREQVQNLQFEVDVLKETLAVLKKTQASI